jgi:hypothetical protein
MADAGLMRFFSFEANHIANWATPQLVIHSGKDYRLGEPPFLPPNTLAKTE